MGEPQWANHNGAWANHAVLRGRVGGGAYPPKHVGCAGSIACIPPTHAMVACTFEMHAFQFLSLKSYFTASHREGGGKVLEKKNQVKMKRKQSFARSIKSLVVGRNLSMKLHAVWAHFPIAWQQAMTSVHYLATNITG